MMLSFGCIICPSMCLRKATWAGEYVGMIELLATPLAPPRPHRHRAVCASSTAPSMAGKRGRIEQAEALHQYLIAHTIREDEHHQHLHALQKASLLHSRARMLSPPDTIAILQFLLHISSARTVIDIGTFTGYTALGMALGVPPEGRVYTLDINDDYVKLGRPFWRQAQVGHKIDFLHAPAAASLHNLLQVLGPASVDLGFIDADKEQYDTYYEQLLLLIRPGGLIVIDNVFWGGAVLDQTDASEATQAIRNLNIKIHQDARVKIAMLKNSDGILLATKL